MPNGFSVMEGAVRELRDDSKTDLDGSPFQLIEYPLHITRSKQFSQELQLNASLMEDRLNLILGGYYADEDGYEITGQRTLGVLSAARGLTINEGFIENKTVAAFGQASFRITDQIGITGGVRYTEDKRRTEARNRNNLTCTSLATNFGGAQTLANCTTGPLKAKFDAWSWTVSLDYKPVEDVMLFVRADRGYRTGIVPMTGGANPNAALTPAQNVAFALATFAVVNPEFALSFEGGIKAQFLDRRIRFNASYYNVKYDDLQRNASGVLPGTNPPAVFNFVANVATARVDGIEADVLFRPIDGLELGGAVSYVHPKYNSYVVGGVDLSGVPFIEVPEWSYSLTGAYTARVGSAEVRFQLDYAWQDATVTSVTQAVTGGVVSAIFPGIRPSNETLNGRIGVTLDNGLAIAVFGKNLTNDRYGNFPLALNTSLGIQTVGGANAPRQFGVEVSAEF